VFFIVLSCLLVIFHSTAKLSLRDNSLTGTIPSQIGLLTKLSESSVVWLFVVMIVVMCISLYSHACLSFFILQLCWISSAII
jgi:formate hydrogenlyase subunit 3/multisubunit Na+/H+ antiporter MnhD subunit